MIIREKITGNEEIISEKDLINSVNSAKVAKFKEINEVKKKANITQSVSNVQIKSNVSTTSKTIDDSSNSNSINLEYIQKLIQNALKSPSEKAQAFKNTPNIINYQDARETIANFSNDALKKQRLGLLIKLVPSNINVYYLDNYFGNSKTSFIAPVVNGCWDIVIYDADVKQISKSLGVKENYVAKFIFAHEISHYADFVALKLSFEDWQRKCQINPEEAEKRAWDYGALILENNHYGDLVSTYRLCQNWIKSWGNIN